MDYVGVFLTTDDYIHLTLPDGNRVPADLLAARTWEGRYEREVIVADLAVLNWMIGRE